MFMARSTTRTFTFHFCPYFFSRIHISKILQLKLRGENFFMCIREKKSSFLVFFILHSTQKCGGGFYSAPHFYYIVRLILPILPPKNAKCDFTRNYGLKRHFFRRNELVVIHYQISGYSLSNQWLFIDIFSENKLGVSKHIYQVCQISISTEQKVDDLPMTFLWNRCPFIIPFSLKRVNNFSSFCRVVLFFMLTLLLFCSISSIPSIL